MEKIPFSVAAVMSTTCNITSLICLAFTTLNLRLGRS